MNRDGERIGQSAPVGDSNKTNSGDPANNKDMVGEYSDRSRDDLKSRGEMVNKGAFESLAPFNKANTELSNEREEDVYGLEISRRMEAYDDVMLVVGNRLGKEAEERVAGEIARIEEVESKTLSAIERRGEALPADITDAARSLSIIGINAYNLTPDETKAVYDYSTDATKEIREQKVEKVADILFHSINGVRSTRDGTDPAFYNPLEVQDKDDLRSRYKEYSEGMLDTERGFDIDAVISRKISNREVSFNEEENLRAILEDMDEWTVEDLLANGYIEESDLYVIGPFNGRDLEKVDSYKRRTWSEVTPDQSINGLSALLDRTVNPHTEGIQSDLVYDYVAGEIMKSRRLGASEMMTAAAAVGLEAINEYGKDMPNMLKSSLSYLSYYSAKMLGYRTDELKQRYKAARPVNAKFYDEVAKMAQGLSDDRREYLEKNYTGYLEKMDDHLMIVMDTLKAKDVGESSLFSDEDD